MRKFNGKKTVQYPPGTYILREQVERLYAYEKEDCVAAVMNALYS